MSPTRHRFPTRLLILVVVGVLFVLVTGLMDGGKGVVPAALWSGPAWASWWSAPWRLFCNALPGLIVAAALLALTRRLALSCLVALALEALVIGVSVLKFKNLGAPLMPHDLLMLGQMTNGGGELLAGYLPHSPWPWLGVVGGVVLIVALARLEPPLTTRRWSLRLPIAVLCCAALVSLIAGWGAWKTVYNGKVLGMQPWSPQASAAQTGLFSSLALFYLQYQKAHDKPDPADALALITSLDGQIQARETTIAAANPADQKPDIVVILSESLFDPTILKGYGPKVDFLPNLHRLARHGTSGWMYPPTFGGGTIRTGFEVMTGLSLRYFPDIQFPWLQLHQKTIPGIVRLLKSRGYSAIAVHGNDPGFWNRTQAFKALGFDRFVSIKDFAPANHVNDGRYLSDKSFTNELLEQLKPDGPPQFVFGLSIEAHGPYDEAYGIDTRVRDAIPVPAAVKGDHRTHLQNYIFHIRHADAQLGRLVKALQKRHRRTIVLLFGDHLPALVPAFQDAGFKNGKGFFFQQVPYIIYDTAHPSAPPVQRNVAAWMLPGLVLARAGIGHTPYYALTDIVGPGLADLSRAPDAPPAQPTPKQQAIEKGLRSVDRLRLEGKLKPLWRQAKAQAATPAPAAAASAP
ncbi:MAG TPA: LTA synthase family protein [Rhodanobacteraceae bacterium]